MADDVERDPLSDEALRADGWMGPSELAAYMKGREAALREAEAIARRSYDAFYEAYQPVHNRKRVDTDYVDRAVRKALAIMEEDTADAIAALSRLQGER